jgi:hypothetical protein
MDPLAIGGIIAALLLVSSMSGSGGASSGAVFVDYQWVILMPSTVSNALSSVMTYGHSQLFPGTLAPSVIASLAPPPGQAPGSGHWVEYPGGYAAALGPQGFQAHGGAGGKGVNQPIAPGDVGNPIFPVFPDVPKGMSVYAWRPNNNVLTVINGYAIVESPWAWEATDSKSLPTTGGILVYAPKWHLLNGPPPPPPGQSAHSGVWHGVAPGYVVWLTPTSTNQAALTQSQNNPALANWYAQGATGGGTTNTAPTLTPQTNPAVPAVASGVAEGFASSVAGY